MPVPRLSRSQLRRTTARACRMASAAAAILLGVIACDGADQSAAMKVADGDAVRGARAIERYGCGACHGIPGIAGANATVGPPLGGFVRSSYVAGVVPNRPEQLVRWIVDPPAIDPRTAMPDLDVSEPEARDIAAYLYAADR